MNKISDLTFVNATTDAALYLWATPMEVPKGVPPVIAGPLALVSRAAILPGHLIRVSAEAADMASLTMVLSDTLPSTPCSQAAGRFPLCVRANGHVRDTCIIIEGNAATGYHYSDMALSAAAAGTPSAAAPRCLPPELHIDLCSTGSVTLFERYKLRVTLCTFTQHGVDPRAAGRATTVAADPPTACEQDAGGSHGGTRVLAHACEPLRDGSGRMQCVMSYIVSPPSSRCA